jgi:hypothetical protein
LTNYLKNLHQEEFDYEENYLYICSVVGNELF